jgi:hypothetical protein
MWSQRFQKNVWLTRHAKAAMAKRDITEDLVYDVIETGAVKTKDATNVWIFKSYPERGDNMLCVAAIIEQSVIVKTVMTDWQPREETP